MSDVAIYPTASLMDCHVARRHPSPVVIGFVFPLLAMTYEVLLEKGNFLFSPVL